MPWYYAGPDAKPVGPIALEELHARRVNGTVSPETYVIEYVGEPNDARAWKRYRDVFPPTSNLSLPPLPPPPAPLVPPPFPTAQAHPLFPSAALAHTQPPAIPPAGHHDPHYSLGTTNPWCSWGFGLSLASLILLLPSCGLTAFVAIPALIISIVGLVKVQHHRDQSGRNLAFAGLFLSGATLLITVIILIFAVPAILKGHGLITTTEQSTNDSD